MHRYIIEEGCVNWRWMIIQKMIICKGIYFFCDILINIWFVIKTNWIYLKLYFSLVSYSTRLTMTKLRREDLSFPWVTSWSVCASPMRTRKTPRNNSSRLQVILMMSQAGTSRFKIVVPLFENVPIKLLMRTQFWNSKKLISSGYDLFPG